VRRRPRLPLPRNHPKLRGSSRWVISARIEASNCLPTRDVGGGRFSDLSPLDGLESPGIWLGPGERANKVGYLRRERVSALALHGSLGDSSKLNPYVLFDRSHPGSHRRTATCARNHLGARHDELPSVQVSAADRNRDFDLGSKARRRDGDPHELQLHRSANFCAACLDPYARQGRIPASLSGLGFDLPND
jgi:hypothetical protein